MSAPTEISRLTLHRQFERVLLSIVRSRRRITSVIVIFGASTFVLLQVIHLAVIKSNVRAPLFADSVILGAAASFFAFLILTAARDRHHKIRDDLRMIAELNHQIRNALQVIVYGEFSPKTIDHRAAVLEGVEKIETTLREMFPLVGERRNDRPWEAHNRARVQNQNLGIHLRERRKG